VKSVDRTSVIVNRTRSRGVLSQMLQSHGTGIYICSHSGYVESLFDTAFYFLSGKPVMPLEASPLGNYSSR
jgi:hypothetical protein